MGRIVKFEVGVTAGEFDGPPKFGVMVGTGVSRLFATAVARYAISCADGSRSNKTSFISERLTF